MKTILLTLAASAILAAMAASPAAAAQRWRCESAGTAYNRRPFAFTATGQREDSARDAALSQCRQARRSRHVDPQTCKILWCHPAGRG
jgi:hypothetical protein